MLVDVSARLRMLRLARALVDVTRLAQETEIEKLRVVTNQYPLKAALLKEVLQEQVAVADAETSISKRCWRSGSRRLSSRGLSDVNDMRARGVVLIGLMCLSGLSAGCRENTAVAAPPSDSCRGERNWDSHRRQSHSVLGRHRRTRK